MSVSEVLPEAFVFVDEVIPSIIQDLRYSTRENFTGEVVDGYRGKRAVLTKEACQALQQAQTIFLRDGYSIVLYDSYRPQKAVDCFMTWSRADQLSVDAEGKKAVYYPTLDREKLFDLGYIAERSGHSRGSTVDVTILEIGKTFKSPPLPKQRRLLRPTLTTTTEVCAEEEIVFVDCQEEEHGFPFVDDGSVDMGSSFDLFHSLSHHDCSPDVLPAIYTKQRNYLRSVMETCGFRAYDQEWWHYTLVEEPNRDVYLDFDLVW
eukprot:gene1476-1605_t